MTAALIVGTELPGLDLRIDRTTAVRYAGASGDFNPIHHSDFAARAIGLEGVIAHGMWTMGAALRVVTDWLGDDSRLLSYGVRFISPVPIPDDGRGSLVQVRARVSEVSEDRAVISIEASCEGTRVLGAARAEIRL